MFKIANLLFLISMKMICSFTKTFIFIFLVGILHSKSLEDTETKEALAVEGVREGIYHVHYKIISNKLYHWFEEKNWNLKFRTFVYLTATIIKRMSIVFLAKKTLRCFVSIQKWTVKCKEKSHDCL